MQGKAAKILLTALVVLFMNQAASAEDLRATAAVDKRSVFLGEAFTFQVQVSGSEAPERPDLSGVSDFVVVYGGGRSNSSTSVTIINGRMTQTVKQGYIFSYQLTPKRQGRLTIPSILVRAEGRAVRTAPLSISVQKPQEAEDFKLRLDLSKAQCYVGEPITLTVTWYLGSDVREFNMSLPLLEEKSLFHFIDPQVDVNAGGKFYRIPVSGGEVIAARGQRRLGDKTYTTLGFSKVLIPKEAGHVDIKPAYVVCEALVGYRKQRGAFGDDLFSDFFDDRSSIFGPKGVYRKIAVPSNPLKLIVSDVPDEGKPVNFAGHVGEYHIEAEATPREMSVGDPVTLRITLSGPEYLEHVNLPPLDQQVNLSKDFKIPQERAVGETLGRSKVYTQTIRPMRPGLEAVPSIELPYFDTKTGKYSVARTDPIPVTVKSARIVTAMDAEGTAAPVSASSEVQTWTEGIAYNYEDMSVITAQRFGPVSWLKSPLILFMTVVSPALFVALLLGSMVVNRLYSDPRATHSRKAHGRFRDQLKKAREAGSDQECCEQILEATRAYLGSKLRMPAGALTFKDAENALTQRAVSADTLEGLRDLFEQCEQGRYAGGSGAAEPLTLADRALELAGRLERKLR